MLTINGLCLQPATRGSGARPPHALGGRGVKTPCLPTGREFLVGDPLTGSGCYGTEATAAACAARAKARQTRSALQTLAMFSLTNVRRIFEYFKTFCVFLAKYSLFKPPSTITSALEFHPYLIYFSPKSLRESNI